VSQDFKLRVFRGSAVWPERWTGGPAVVWSKYRKMRGFLGIFRDFLRKVRSFYGFLGVFDEFLGIYKDL